MPRPVARAARATAVLLVCAVGAPLAQQPPEPDPVYDAKGFQPNRDYYSPLPFENIDAVSGNLLLTFDDLTLPGNDGLDLGFTRAYNSKAGGRWHFGLQGLPLAVRWAAPHWAGGEPTNYKMPTFETADGAQHPTHWLQYIGVDNVLLTTEFWRYTVSTRRLELPNGLVAAYDVVVPRLSGGGNDAFLTAVSDPFGNTITLTWTDGRLAAVRQDLGAGEERVVTFSYRPGAWTRPVLAFPSGMSFNGRTWQYFFGSSDPLIEDLVEAKPPIGPSWRFAASPFTVITPHGGKVKYSDALFQMLSGKKSEREGTPVYKNVMMLSQRTTEDADGSVTGTWTFNWVDVGISGTRLTISGVVRVVKYECTWLESGPVASLRTIEAGGQTLETEALQHHEVDLWVAPSVDQQKYVLLDSRTVTRGTKNYATTYTYSSSNYFDYGHPNQIAEAGDLSRTSVVYEHGFTPYIRAQVASASVTVGSEAYTRSSAHDPAAGFVTARTVYGITTTFAPDGRGTVATATDANGRTTTFTYSWGATKDVSTPEYSIAREVNPDGTVAQETRRGLTTVFGYDAAGRPTLVTPPEGEAALTEYDDTSGAWTKTSRGPTYFTQTTRDGFGRAIATEDAAGVKTKVSYDAEGRQVYQSYPYEGASDTGDSFQYDALNRVTRATHADGSYAETAYADGDITITDELDHGANARTTVQRWRAFGDPGDARLLSLRDPAGSEWTYSYSGLGALTRVDGPGDVPDRVWVYNGQHQLQSDTQPESGHATYGYDNAGNLAWKTDARGTTFYFTYDGNNRLTRIDAPGDADDVDIWYDASDNRTRLKNATVDSTFVFDGADRLTSRTDDTDGQTFVTAYQYDGRDTLTRIVYPSGRQVDFSPGAQGRITSVTGPGTSYATGIEYHPSGTIKALTLANGAVETVTFDARQRPEWLRTGPLDIFYTYDAVGNVTSIDDARAGFDTSYGYDELDRLRWITGNGAREYTYDAAGNRLTKKVGAYTYSYSYDASTQRLTGTDDVPMQGAFAYDPVGNTTSDAAGTYAHTPFNLLATATVAGATSSYGYDGDNLRVRKVTSQDTRYSVHGAGSQLLAEYVLAGGAPVLVREYVYLGSKLLASWAPDETPTPGGRVTGVTATPQSAPKNTTITVTISGTSQPCSKVDVNFGDGTVTPYTIASPYQLPLVVTHTYTAAGLYTIVASGQSGASGPCTGMVSAPLEVTSGNVITNGDFSQVDGSGFPIGWGIFTQGGSGYWNASTGVFNFYRTEGMTQAVTLQYTGLALPTGAPLDLVFRMGNSDTVRKRLSVMIHTPGFDDLALCTFWLDPQQPLRDYAMRTHTTKAWADATASFYAADANASGSTGAYQLDDVSLTYRPAFSSAKTDCVDPNRPTSGGETGANILQNGNFDSGTTAWALTGQLASQVANNALDFHRISGSPAPLIAQVTATTGAQDQRWAALFELGNASSTRQRVTIQLQNSSGATPTDFTNCVFWLAPNAPRQAYAITTYAAASWPTGAGITVTPATTAPAGSEPAYRWLQFDTVSLSKTTQATVGTECFEPGSFEIEGGAPAPVPVPVPLAASLEAPVAVTSSAPAPVSSASTSAWRLTFGAAPENGAPEAAPLADGAPPPVVALTVGLGGVTSGTVTSSPAGISCGGPGLVCTGWFAEGTTVTLTATPDAGQSFAGWAGDCSGTGTCVVSMVGAQSVSAVFTGPLVRTFYHLDAMGSVRAVTDASGATVKRHDYLAFGEDTAPMSGDPLRFAGKELDAETALQYFGARYYRNTVGRFTSVDPVLDRETTAEDPRRWNRFAYALNNPLKFVDPDGEVPLLVLLWGAYEVGSTLYDAYTAYKTARNPNATAAEKAAAGGGLVLGAILPGGGYGTAGKAIVGKADDAARVMKRGRESEARVLDALGETKNTKAVKGCEGCSVPDYQNPTTVGEIKDSKRVSDSAQLRIQREAAAQSGRQHVVVTGTNSKVSKTVQDSSTVVRRKDLGPTGKK